MLEEGTGRLNKAISKGLILWIGGRWTVNLNSSNRIMLNVIAAYGTDGSVIPMYIIWRSGKVSKIAKVLDIKSGIATTKFTCQLQSETIDIWVEEGRWLLDMS